MKKTFLLALFAASLALVGCTQQTSTGNQNTNQPTANINQNANQPVANQNSNQSIIKPSITILSPNGGEIWAIGTMQTIKWKSTDLENKPVNIFLDNDEKNFGQCYLGSVTTDQSQFKLIIPSKCPEIDAKDIIAGKYKIHILVPIPSDPENPQSYNDYSDNSFNITIPNL